MCATMREIVASSNGGFASNDPSRGLKLRTKNTKRPPLAPATPTALARTALPAHSARRGGARGLGRGRDWKKEPREPKGASVCVAGGANDTVKSGVPTTRLKAGCQRHG